MSDLLPHVRPLLESDFEAIYPIEQAAHQEPWSQANLLSCFGPRYLNGLMLVDGRPAGFYISDLVAGDSSLMNICVPPDFQGKGLGRALLREYLARSKASKVSVRRRPVGDSPNTCRPSRICDSLRSHR